MGLAGTIRSPLRGGGVGETQGGQIFLGEGVTLRSHRWFSSLHASMPKYVLTGTCLLTLGSYFPDHD
jgi:hypothetical protein